MITAYVFYILFGYLSGSVLYSYLIPKHFCHMDVRTVHEERNPGAFNAFAAAGPRVGLICDRSSRSPDLPLPRRFPASCRRCVLEVCWCHLSCASAIFSACGSTRPKMLHLQFSLCLLK